MKSMIKIIINGIQGKVGRTIVQHLSQFSEILCTGGSDLKTEPIPGLNIPIVQDIKTIISECDTVIDFSTPAGMLEKLPICVKFRKAMIIGTTGFTSKERAKIISVSKKIPIVLSSNFSLGANLLFKEAAVAAQVLDESYDVEIVEQHHRYKKDAPSGTALTAGESIAKIRKKSLEKIARWGRGRTEPRQKGEITFHSVRGGHLISEHTILFLGDHEIFEITHRAYSREVFLDGLKKAIHFIINQKPGLYDMLDVLNLK